MKDTRLKVAFLIDNSLYTGVIDGYVMIENSLNAVVVSQYKDKTVFRTVNTDDLKVLSDKEYTNIKELSEGL